jgi:hypothetical protein
MTPYWIHKTRGKTSEVLVNKETNECVKHFVALDPVSKRQKQVKAQRGSLYQSFLRELEALERLSGCDHFPTLLDHDEDEMWIKMSFCGESFPVNAPRNSYPELLSQVDEIVNTLQTKKIRIPYKKYFKARGGQRYPYFSAQNLTLMQDTIYVIDFEQALCDNSRYNRYFLPEFVSGYDKYDYDDFKKIFTELLVIPDDPLYETVYTKSGTKMLESTNGQVWRDKWVGYQNNPIGNNVKDRIEKFSLMKYTNPSRTAIDIGANQGRFALTLASHFKEIHAVEPFVACESSLPENMVWHKKSFKDFCNENNTTFDVVMTFACTLQICQLDLLEEHVVAKMHADLVAPNGYLIYESQKIKDRLPNETHVKKILAGFEMHLGKPIESGKARANGDRRYYVFHKKA